MGTQAYITWKTWLGSISKLPISTHTGRKGISFVEVAPADSNLMVPLAFSTNCNMVTSKNVFAQLLSDRTDPSPSAFCLTNILTFYLACNLTLALDKISNS